LHHPRQTDPSGVCCRRGGPVTARLPDVAPVRAPHFPVADRITSRGRLMSTRRPFSARSSLLSLSLLALATAACTPPAAPADQGEPPRSVTVIEVSVGTSTDEVDVIGELEGSEEIQIFSQVSEVIQKLPVKEGQRVKKGDLLVLVTGDLQTSALRQSQAALESAIANRDAVMDNLRRTRQLV